MSQEKTQMEKLAVPTGFGALVAALIYFGFVKTPETQVAEQIALEKRLVAIEASVQRVAEKVTLIDSKIDDRSNTYVRVDQFRDWAFHLKRDNATMTVPMIDANGRTTK